MKHSIVIGLLLAGMALPVESGTMECVTVQSCPKGVKPPACCKPPPCELFEQIRMKQAVKRLYSKPEVRKRLIRTAGGDNAAAAKLLNDFVVNEASTLGSKLRCPWKAPFVPPPGFETNSECQIVVNLPGGAEPISRETALRTLDTCSEFIEAAYDHEKLHKDICMRSNSVERLKMGIKDYAAEESAGYEQELQSLRSRLRQYWSACSAQADATTARNLADAGIKVLKKKSARKGG
jgi:hypothetical protein